MVLLKDLQTVQTETTVLSILEELLCINVDFHPLVYSQILYRCLYTAQQYIIVLPIGKKILPPDHETS